MPALPLWVTTQQSCESTCPDAELELDRGLGPPLGISARLWWSTHSAEIHHQQRRAAHPAPLNEFSLMFLLFRKSDQMPWSASGRLDSAIPPSVPPSGSQAKTREQTLLSALRAGTSSTLSEFLEVCQDLANLHLLIYQQASEINYHDLAKIIGPWSGDNGRSSSFFQSLTSCVHHVSAGDNRVASGTRGLSHPPPRDAS